MTVVTESRTTSYYRRQFPVCFMQDFVAATVWCQS